MQEQPRPLPEQEQQRPPPVQAPQPAGLAQIQQIPLNVAPARAGQVEHDAPEQIEPGAPAPSQQSQPVLVEPVPGQRVVFDPAAPANHSNAQRNIGRALPTDALLVNERQYQNAVKNFNKRWPAKLQALFNQTEVSGIFIWYDRRLLGSGWESTFNCMASNDLKLPLNADVLEYMQTAMANGLNAAFARHVAQLPTQMAVDESLAAQQVVVDRVSKQQLLSQMGDMLLTSYRGNLQLGMACEHLHARRLNINSRNLLCELFGIAAQSIPILPMALGLAADQVAPMPHFDAFRPILMADQIAPEELVEEEAAVEEVMEVEAEMAEVAVVSEDVARIVDALDDDGDADVQMGDE